MIWVQLRKEVEYFESPLLRVYALVLYVVPPCRGDTLDESLHRFFPKRYFQMCPLGVVVIHPCVEVGLKLFDGGVYLLAESDGVELVLHGTVEPLADAVCLRALCLYLG